jgi:hypothetical protein
MLRATSLRSSGVKTPEFAGLFGTAEAVPSREPFVKWLLVLCVDNNAKKSRVFRD